MQMIQFHHKDEQPIELYCFEVKVSLLLFYFKDAMRKVKKDIC